MRPPRLPTDHTDPPTLTPSQTRRHEDTKKSQSRHPPDNAEAQRRGGAERVVEDFNARRGSGRRMASGNRWARPPLRMQASESVSWPSGLRFESASLAPPLLHSIAGKRMPPSLTREEMKGRTGVPSARRPVRRLAATNVHGRSRRPSHRRQAISSPVVLPSRDDTAFHAQRLLLCVFAPLRYRVGGGFVSS